MQTKLELKTRHFLLCERKKYAAVEAYRRLIAQRQKYRMKMMWNYLPTFS